MGVRASYITVLQHGTVQTLPSHASTPCSHCRCKRALAYHCTVLYSRAHRQSSHGSRGRDKTESGVEKCVVLKSFATKYHTTLLLIASRICHYFESGKATMAAMASLDAQPTIVQFKAEDCSRHQSPPWRPWLARHHIYRMRFPLRKSVS